MRGMFLVAAAVVADVTEGAVADGAPETDAVVPNGRPATFAAMPSANGTSVAACTARFDAVLLRLDVGRRASAKSSSLIYCSRRMFAVPTPRPSAALAACTVTMVPGGAAPAAGAV